MKAKLNDLHTFKTDRWNIKLKNLQTRITPDWTETDLDLVLKGLRRNKTRDPHGLVNELFKPGVMGRPMKLSLLKLLNKVKSEQKLPDHFQYANISTIYKNKGSRLNMDNDRGIFVVSALRMILDSLIYNDKYSHIDRNMTNSNIGARRDRNIRDHLFIVYGIVNSIVNGTEDEVDIKIYDVEKCFDTLWLENCMLDLLDTLPSDQHDDKVSLLYKMNIENRVAVKTPFGFTERIDMPKIVMQGGKWGPLKCSNSIDKIGKKCLTSGQHIYLYKGIVKIMPLAMIDDLLVVNKCGLESVKANIFINSQIEMKKMRLHTPKDGGKSKCHVIHVSKRKTDCQELKVHGFKMEKVYSDTYLGDIVTADGKNTLNIEARVAKGLGLTSQILDILKVVNFGAHYFETAIALRNAVLINGMLTNAEVWYGLTQGEIRKLEDVDKLYLRQVFRVSSSCPTEAFYLETGLIPIHIIIQARRLNYLHHLVTRDTNETLFKVFKVQWNNPVKNDWVVQVKDDLQVFGISDHLEGIKSFKKSTFKEKVKTGSKIIAFRELLAIKSRHSKLKNLVYTEFNMQNYLKADSKTSLRGRVIFKSRTRMTSYWKNFKGAMEYQKCKLCNEKDTLDCQEHSFECKVIRQHVKIENVKFKDIFGSEIKVNLADCIEKIENFRKEKLSH